MACVLARFKVNIIWFEFSLTLSLDFAAELGYISHWVDVIIIKRIEHVVSGIDILIAFYRLLLVPRRQ